VIFEKINSYCEKSGIGPLINGATAVIVGFSGGADSSVLLSYFAAERERDPSLSVIAAHVNHMIRGAEADSDEEFCRRVCEELCIPFVSERIDVPALARERGCGTEEAARIARYGFFESLLERYPGAVAATAHSADDNLETVIFNLCRGSGVRGLCGIAPIRQRYVRPLLCCTAAEIRSYAKERGIAYVTDSTNTDVAYTRNAVRKNIVPALREINSKAAESALRLSELAREDCDYIESEAKRLLCGGITRRELSALHPALFARVIALMYESAAGGRRNLSEKNIRDCRAVADSTEKKSISLPGGFSLFGYGDRVFVAREERGALEQLETKETPLIVGKPVVFGGFCVLLSEKDEYIAQIEENVYNLSLHGHVDCDKINGNLCVRSRRPGDVIKKGGMNKKLKKLLCDESIPQMLRDCLPIIEDGNGILFVPYIGARDGVRAEKSTERILSINISERS